MTCTIHYSLRTNADGPGKAKSQLELLRQRALALPFKAVSEMHELSAAEWQNSAANNSDPLFHVAITASMALESLDLFRTAPFRTLAFVSTVGEGCENAIVGLRRLPFVCH